MEYIKLKVIPVEQKVGMFYISAMNPRDISLISRSDLSRYENSEKGVQRTLSKQRQAEIRKYLLNDPEATFPNNIILSITNDFENPEEPNYILEEDTDGTVVLKIKKSEDVVSILDGQHRMSGFAGGVDFKFDIPVSIFLDPPLSLQAKVFAKINGKQVKVNNDLVYDLFGITKGRSTEKTAYSIVKHLNEDMDSVWRDGIKTLTDRYGYIAQGSFAKYIDLELISENKPLRKMYIDERDEDILQVLKNYFKAVSVEFANDWKSQNQKIILQKTTGFVGMMKLFKDLVEIAATSDHMMDIDFFTKYISGSSANCDALLNENYPAGAKGQNKFYRQLSENIYGKE